MNDRNRETRGGMRARARVLGAAVAVLTACTGDGGGPLEHVVRDSVGVRIVENEGPNDVAASWEIAEAAALDIGVLDGDEAYQLFQVSGVARFGGGEIVVGNGGTRELRFYDSNGRFLRAVGGKGGGPGEFEGLGQVAAVGDSILVWDWNLSRISVFDREGTFVRSYLVSFPGGGSPSALGAFEDRNWLFTTSFTFAPSKVSTVVRDTNLYVRLGPQGEYVDSIGRFPAVEFFVVGDERRASASSLAFGRRTVHAIAGRNVYLGSTDRHEIRRFTEEGELDLIVRKTHEHLSVTGTDLDRYKEQRLEDAPDDNWRRQLERLLQDMPIPSTMPAFDGMLADKVGNLWVSEYLRPGEAPPRWSVFDSTGVLLGTVQTPTDLDIHEIGSSYILGTWKDDLGVEHVHMCSLSKGEE
jgi:hypothetical protein